MWIDDRELDFDVKNNDVGSCVGISRVVFSYFQFYLEPVVDCVVCSNQLTLNFRGEKIYGKETESRRARGIDDHRGVY